MGYARQKVAKSVHQKEHDSKRRPPWRHDSQLKDVCKMFDTMDMLRWSTCACRSCIERAAGERSSPLASGAISFSLLHRRGAWPLAVFKPLGQGLFCYFSLEMYRLHVILCRAGRQVWQELTGREIKFKNIDVAKEYDLLLQLFKDYKPDTVCEHHYILESPDHAQGGRRRVGVHAGCEGVAHRCVAMP